ncbi:MAG: glycosyltransferase [Anaerolineae bacterium]|nr:glycosyltransferase [Anaerolineae bacterium]
MDTWLLIPDSCIRWLPAALWMGLRVGRQFDVIYSTSSPFTDHIVAYFLHKIFEKPWIADFRDPWTQYGVYQQSSQLRARIDIFLESLLLKASDIVAVTCAATARSFQDTHPSLPQDKFVEITNGFDADDFELTCSPFSTFTIAYTGRFDSQKNASSAFLQALGEIRREYPELVPEIKVIFAGSFEERSRVLLEKWSLEDMVELRGYISHEESVKLLLKSHVLLLTLSDERGVNLTYPGKLFEYLAAQKTILSLVPAGAAADLIGDMEAGPIVSSENVEAIKETVLKLYHQYKRGDTLLKIYKNLDRFERRSLTERLAQYLDVVA